MHYDRVCVRILPTRTAYLLKTHPLNREAIIAMIKSGIVLEFKNFNKHTDGNPICGGGFMVILPNGKAFVCIHDGFSIKEKEEALYHELAHLHLRRIVNAEIINDCEPEIHAIVVNEGKRLATKKPIPFWELVTLCLYNYLMPLSLELAKQLSPRT